MTIEEAQKTVDQWIKTYGVRYFSELTNMAILTEEVGEVARIIARTYGEQSDGQHPEPASLGDELADVFFVSVMPRKSDRHRPYLRIYREYREENQTGFKATP